MKKFVKYLLILIILPIAFLFVGCSNEQLESIKSISKTIDGLKEIYTITYENGDVDTFTVLNEDNDLSVVSIEKTGSEGLIDIYTITYIDGSTEQFTITNGKDAASIESITKTATQGLVDTYTIKYKDGRVEHFNVTNGDKGDTGPQGVSIVSIDKTNSVGLVDTYTITYSNGQTDTFTITNGEDGENLYSNITINDLFEEVKKNENKPADYDIVDFINEYLDFNIDQNAIASSKALRSAVAIYVEHEVEIVDYTNRTGYNPITGNTYGVTNSISWGAGSGVIYDLDPTTGDAYIITNYHVCYSADTLATDGIATKFTLYAYGGETMSTDLNALSNYNNNNADVTYSSQLEFDENGLPVINYGWGAIEAEYVGGSEQYDIAVLKVTGSEVLKDSDYLEVEVYDSDLVSVGSTAIAVGNPGAGGIAVTNGVISIDSTYTEVAITDSNNPISFREFRIDTPVNGGNSGGGLFDNYGRLIGIVNAKYSGTAYDDINYAIPSNIGVRVADMIIDTCDGVDKIPNRVLVGLAVQTINSKGYYDEDAGVMRIKETVKIATINNNSLASNAGLQVEDILTSVEIVKENQTIVVEIDRRFKLIDAMLYAREGDIIKFNYTRDGIAGTAVTQILTSDNFIEVG